MFWLMFFMWLAFTVVGELLRPKPKFGNPQPSPLGDFQVPTAEEGRCVPILWGTCRVKGPNVVWYGDLYSIAVKKKVKTGWFSSTKITLGFKYYMGQDLALCYGPVDELIELKFGEKKIVLKFAAPFAHGTVWSINEPNLFGGITSDGTKGGGVVGDIAFYYGTTTQPADPYLESKIGKALPGYRGVCHAVLRRPYLGTESYLKHPAFLIRRCPNTLGLTGDNHNIGGDANAACMIYELLTDQRWGVGIPSVMIDTASFIAMGNALADESLGLSMLVDSPMAANDLIQDIMRHVDGVLYTDPETGLITVKLARDDYDVETLPIYDESIIKEFDFTRGSWSDTKNTVKITFTDRDQDYQTRVAQDQEVANVLARNGEISPEQINFRGLSNSVSAALVAARVRKTVSYPLARGRMKVNRKAWALRPSSVFKVNWEPEGIVGMVVRATKIRYGTIEDGWIEVDVVEDIFNVSAASYIPPPGTEWVNPYGQPQPAAYSQLVESPAQLAGGQLRGVMTYAIRANGLDQGYDVWSDPAGGTAYTNTASIDSFNATGTLINPLLKTGAAQLATLTIAGGMDMEGLVDASETEFQAGQSLMQIDDELIAWKTRTDNLDGTFTFGIVWRAVIDTVQQDHIAGARVWFLDGTGLVDYDPYPADVTVKAKLLPFNLVGKVLLATPPILTCITASRAWKPLPAGNVKVNAITWPTTTVGDAVATWAKRHRVEQTNAQKIVAQDAADYSANIEGTYTVTIYVGGVLKQTITSIAVTTYTYTATQRLAHDADGTKITRIRIEPVNGAYTGAAQDRDFTMTGFGMTFGLYFGGIQS